MVRVELAVYDLSMGMAAQLSLPMIGTHVEGIWHTGVVLFGYEYFFGGGIQRLPQGAFTRSRGMAPVQMLVMGETTKSQSEVDAFVSSIRHRFTQSTYDLIRHNCNNFSNELVQFLLNKEIPHNILHLAQNVFSTPGGAMLRPMIEGMQNRVREDTGGGADPFGNSSSHNRLGGGSLDPFGGAVDSNIQFQQHRPVPAAPVPPVQVNVPLTELEFRNPLISLEGVELIPKLMQRILSGLEGLVNIQGLQNLLPTNHYNDATFSITAVALSSLLNYLSIALDQVPAVHLPVLFVLRLMVRKITTSIDLELSASYQNLLGNILRRLQYHDLSAVETSESPVLQQGFSSNSAYIMAVCVLNNVVAALLDCSDVVTSVHYLALSAATQSNAAGSGGSDNQVCERLLECIFKTLDQSSSISIACSQQCLNDLQLAGSALLYNVTTVYTQYGKHDHHWRVNATVTVDPDAVHPSAIQIICCLLEGAYALGSSNSDVVRMRLLSVLCMIARAYSSHSSSSDHGDSNISQVAAVTAVLHSQLRHLLVDLDCVRPISTRKQELTQQYSTGSSRITMDELQLVFELARQWT